MKSKDFFKLKKVKKWTMVGVRIMTDEEAKKANEEYLKDIIDAENEIANILKRDNVKHK